MLVRNIRENPLQYDDLCVLDFLFAFHYICNYFVRHVKVIFKSYYALDVIEAIMYNMKRNLRKEQPLLSS